MAGVDSSSITEDCTFTVDPYSYEITVDGVEEETKALMQAALNVGDNGKNLYKHIYYCATQDGCESSQITKESKMKYEASTNSITIGIGSRFDLGNGYSVTVQEDCVWGEGYGKGSQADDERCNMMVGGLSSLIHFADQQYFSSMTDTYTNYILQFLASQGVDTSREFVINGTHCELVNGKIREVNNDYVVPSSIQAAAVKRYEEKMSEFLKDGNCWHRMA